MAGTRGGKTDGADLAESSPPDDKCTKRMLICPGWHSAFWGFIAGCSTGSTLLPAGSDALLGSTTPLGWWRDTVVCGLIGMRGFSLHTGGFLVNVLRLDEGFEFSDSTIRPDATRLDCKTMAFVFVKVTGAGGAGELGGLCVGCSLTDSLVILVVAGTGSEKDVIFSTSGFLTASIDCSDFFSKFSRFFICSLLLLWFVTAVRLRAIIPPVSTCPFRMGETKLILGQSDVGPFSFMRGALVCVGADWPKGRMVTRGADAVDAEELTRFVETP